MVSVKSHFAASYLKTLPLEDCSHQGLYLWVYQKVREAFFFFSIDSWFCRNEKKEKPESAFGQSPVQVKNAIQMFRSCCIFSFPSLSYPFAFFFFLFSTMRRLFVLLAAASFAVTSSYACNQT